MKQLSLQSLMLLVTCVGISFAWWVQSSTPHDILYLHVYSGQYYHTATIGISPEVPFHADFSENDSEKVIHGMLEFQGGEYKCTLDLTINERFIVDKFSATKLVPLNTLVDFSSTHFAVLSEISDPNELLPVLISLSTVDNNVLIRSGEAQLVGRSRLMLYYGFNILHRSVVRWQTGLAARITRTLS